jgi:branched-chain amino acid transport system substrate-binding protein
MRTRFAALAGATLMLAGTLVACGGQPAASSPGTSGAPNKLSGPPVKIGVVLSMTGVFAAAGGLGWTGIQMAAEDLNAGAGILGRPVELILADDKSDPATGAQVTRKLIDQDNVDLIAGPTVSSIAGPVMAIANPAKKVQINLVIAPAAGDPVVNPYTFRSAAVSTLNGAAAVEYLKKKNFTKIAVFYVNQATGTTSLTAIQEAIKGTNISIVSAISHDAGQVDLVAPMQQLQKSGAQVVFIYDAGGDTAAAIKARNTIGWNVVFYGNSPIADPDVTKAAGGPSAMTNVVAGMAAIPVLRKAGESNQPEPLAITKVKKFLKTSTLTTDVSTPFLGYDGVMLMAKGAQLANSLDADKMKAAIEQLGRYKGFMGEYVYTASRHDGLEVSALVFVQAGSFQDGTFLPAD